MLTLTTTTNAARRETTVTAKDAQGAYICSETWMGTGARLASALTAHVRTSAEQELRRRNRSAGSSTRQTRLLADRL
jgi:hypothetical protein